MRKHKLFIVIVLRMLEKYNLNRDLIHDFKCTKIHYHYYQSYRKIVSITPWDKIALV